MTTEQNMLNVLIQHQVYRYRASTKVVNELQDQVDEALRHVVDYGGYDDFPLPTLAELRSMNIETLKEM